MSKKALNRKNLIELGTETLADLLLDVIKGNAVLQRRVRMELSASAGASEIARDIRKRFATLRRATSFLEWHQQRNFAKELHNLTTLITTRVAPEAPKEAFDLLWTFLQLAPSIHERTDDSNGEIGAVMDEAMEAISDLSPRLDPDPVTLANMVFEALEGNGYGEFDGVIPALGTALGSKGLEHLKLLAKTAESRPPQKSQKHSDLRTLDFTTGTFRPLEYSPGKLTYQIILQDIADLQNDVDAYMAHYSAEQLTFHTIAPDVAIRLLAAGRHEEALQIIEAARKRATGRLSNFYMKDLHRVYIDCLESSGQIDEVKRVLWEDFCANLNVESLRRYLRMLPDFEDIEAEEKAKSIAMKHDNLSAALMFFVNWPDLASAADLIKTRHAELDGNKYEVLTPAAKTLSGEHPLAAVLAYRSMILYSLENSKASRYDYAARHLKTCAELDITIGDYKPYPTHAAFTETLRKKHSRKSGFWERVGA